MTGKHFRRAAIFLAALFSPGLAWLFFMTLYDLRPLGPLPEFPGTVLEKTGGDWGSIVVPQTGCVLRNNVWNKAAAGGEFQQEIFLGKYKGKQTIGWRWRAPWQVIARVVSQPELVCGDKPWDEPLRLNPSFPVRAGAKRITANFDIKLRASGTYNMAFSLWAVSSLPASRNVITHEIMIWNAHAGQAPAGSKQGRIDVAGVPYEVYLEKNHKDASGSTRQVWTYVAFVAERPVLKGPLDLSAFVDWLLEQKLLSRDHYLTSGEIGNEVCQGTGIVEVRDFSVGVQ